jgi:lipopolysaccharide transport system permease protein
MQKNRTITIYEPGQRTKMSFFAIWLMMVKNILNSRELIFQLFKRDFFMPYKKSFIGIAWIFISPIIGIVSWVFMNAAGILNPGDVGIPYPAYVLLSTSIWGLFMGFYSSAAGTLGAGGGIIMQVKYPHEALLVQQTAQHLSNFLLGFIMNIAVLLAFGVVPDWKIIFFPVMALPLFFLGAGIGLVASVINVVSVDFNKGFNFMMGILMFLTPVIYSSKVDNPILQKVMTWNPLTYLVGGFRDVIIYGRLDYLDRYLYATLLSFFIFMFAWRLFFVSEEKVIEKMI